jgi:thiol-disulfide isomerase/thioredoxin
MDSTAILLAQNTPPITLGLMWFSRFRVLWFSLLLGLFLIPSGALGKQSPEKRGWLGIAMEKIDGKKRTPSTRIIVIDHVFPGSAAHRAGAKAGDRILQLNKKTIRLIADVIREVRQHSIGDKLKLVLERNNQRMTLVVTLTKRPSHDQILEQKWLNQPFPPALRFSHYPGTKKWTAHTMKGKPFIFKVWATTCGPCKSAVPMLRALERRYAKRKFKVLSATIEDARIVSTYAAKKKNVPAHILLDGDKHISRKLNLFSRPTLLYIDDKGFIRAMDFGLKTPSHVENVVSTLLLKKGAKSP